MNSPIELVKFLGIALIISIFMIWTLKKVPALFALVGIFGLGELDYEAIKHLIETWPPRTFLNGAQIFCFIPFLTFGTLMYVGMLWMAATGKLDEEDGNELSPL